VPPCSRAFGNPLRFAGLNLHALRLHASDFPPERIAFFERAFRELYRGKRPIAEVIDELKKGPEPLFQAFFDDHWSGSLVRP
jgi:UDP-N-acetylglucosamine acyltransferase